MNNKNFNRFQFSLRAPTKAQTYVHFLLEKDSLTGWEVKCISSRGGICRKYEILSLGFLEETVQKFMEDVYGIHFELAYFTFPYNYGEIAGSFTLYKMPHLGEGYWELICYSGSGKANSYTLTGLHELEKMVNDFFSILDGYEDGLLKS